jgi:hypothetical protein
VAEVKLDKKVEEAAKGEVDEAEEDDAVDDWEDADLDEIVEKAKTSNEHAKLELDEDEQPEVVPEVKKSHE